MINCEGIEIKKLSDLDKVREIFWQKVLKKAKSEGWTVAEIASTVGCTKQYVRRMLKSSKIKGVARRYMKQQQQQQQLQQLWLFLDQHPDSTVVEYCSRIRENYKTIIQRLSRNGYRASSRLAGVGKSAYPELSFFLYHQEKYPIKTIANLLNRTPRTIKRHLSTMQAKVEGQSRSALVFGE